MSRGAEVSLSCWDGEHQFRLRIGELRQLQEKCDAGPMHIARRLADGSWLLDDIRETIRLGLIGAGIKQQDALRLVSEHVDSVPLIQNVVTAQAIILAAVMGVEDEPVGEAPAAGEGNASNEESSPSPPSTAPGS